MTTNKDAQFRGTYKLYMLKKLMLFIVEDEDIIHSMNMFRIV